MLFEKIHISNFRSFDEHGETIEFSEEKNIYALIGQNSSGKSNILDALALVLENYKSDWGEGKISKSDFYQEKLYGDDGKAIILCIELYFRGDSVKVENANKFITKSTHTVIRGIRFTAKVREKGEEKESIKWDNVCFGDDGKPIGAMGKSWKKPDEEISEDDIVVERGFEVLRASTLMKKMPKSYFLDAEGLKGFLKLGGYAPLARLMEYYKNDLRKNKDGVEMPLGDRCKSSDDEADARKIEEYDRSSAIKSWSEELVGLIKTDLLKNIETKLGEKTAKYLGLDFSDLKIEFGAIQIEEIINKIIELKIKDTSEEFLPINRQGQGYLSLLRLAVLETLKELRDLPPAILLIEEPEIYLHPSLQRHCYSVLNSLADAGYQVLYTTHSPELVSLESYDSIISVAKHGATTRTKNLSQYPDIEFDRMERKLLEKGNRELFFSRKVVLVEGKGDQIALKLLLEKLNVLVDLEGIFIVDCAGKDNMPDYVKLCTGLGISYFVVHDTDLDASGNQVQETKDFVSKIKTLIEENGEVYSEVSYAFPDKLEVSLGIDSKKDRKIIALLEPKSGDQILQDHPDLNALLEKMSQKMGLSVNQPT